jgi:hypothetical protein
MNVLAPALRQREQWHVAIIVGGDVSSNRIEPQQQLPDIIGVSLIKIATLVHVLFFSISFFAAVSAGKDQLGRTKEPKSLLNDTKIRL